MTDPYEALADFVLSTQTGQCLGWSREALVAHFRKVCPDPVDLQTTWHRSVGQAEARLARAGRKLPMPAPPWPVH